MNNIKEKVSYAPTRLNRFLTGTKKSDLATTAELKAVNEADQKYTAAFAAWQSNSRDSAGKDWRTAQRVFESDPNPQTQKAFLELGPRAEHEGRGREKQKALRMAWKFTLTACNLATLPILKKILSHTEARLTILKEDVLAHYELLEVSRPEKPAPDLVIESVALTIKNLKAIIGSIEAGKIEESTAKALIGRFYNPDKA